MVEKFLWLIWLILVILWNYGFPEATPFQDVFVAVILSLLFIIIKLMRSRYLHKMFTRSKNREINYGLLVWEFIMTINLLEVTKR